MVGHSSPSELNCDDPQFPQQIAVWVAQAQHDMQLTVVATKKTIYESRALLANVDRVLARR